MQSVSYAQELLYNIQYDLCNIEILQPDVFVQQLLCFPLLGLEERVVATIREVMHQFQTERTILKYIYILDKLMKVPAFLPAIHGAIVQIYTEMFGFLLQQKCSTEIEELKILRKYWVGRLHPYYLNQMKEAVLQRTSIDIDCGFKQETINRIRQYYSSKLNLSNEEMAQHLPSQRKNEERYPSNSMNTINTLSNINPINPLGNMNTLTTHNNQRYMVEANSLYPDYSIPMNPLPTPTPSPNPYSYHSQSQSQSHSYYPSFPSYPQQQVGVAYGRALQAEGHQQVKRKRLASEQTRAAVPGSMFEGVQPTPRKLQHRNQVIIDYKFMLSKLKRMNPFGCRECGLTFMTSEACDAHKGDHFKEKLTRNEKAQQQRGKTGKLCSVQDWLSKSDLDFSLDQFYISMAPEELQPRLCYFCCAPLDLHFRNNRWVYTNAAHVAINQIPAVVHKSCQLALETQHEQESSQ